MSASSATASPRSPNEIAITKAEQLDRLIVHASRLDLPGRVVLLRAVRAGEIALIETTRDGIVSGRRLERLTRPAVVLLGDDDGDARGPTGWASARGLLCWARAGMVHGSGATAATYQSAVAMALVARRFLLVETDCAHVTEWSAALLQQRVRCVCVRPPDDGVHPIAPVLAS